jgi:hypothetical protein
VDVSRPGRVTGRAWRGGGLLAAGCCPAAWRMAVIRSFRFRSSRPGMVWRTRPGCPGHVCERTNSQCTLLILGSWLRPVCRVLLTRSVMLDTCRTSRMQRKEPPFGVHLGRRHAVSGPRRNWPFCSLSVRLSPRGKRSWPSRCASRRPGVSCGPWPWHSAGHRGVEPAQPVLSRNARSGWRAGVSRGLTSGPNAPAVRNASPAARRSVGRPPSAAGPCAAAGSPGRSPSGREPAPWIVLSAAGRPPAGCRTPGG